MSSDTVPRWPRIDAIVREDGSGEVTIDGTFHPITTGSLEEARVEVLRRVTENAAKVGRPVRASATGPEGLWNLIVHPDGTVVPEEDDIAPAQAPAPAPQAPVSPPAPGPVFERAPIVDRPPQAATSPADPLGTPVPDATRISGTTETGRPTEAAGSDPHGSAVEADPEDTVRRVTRTPEAPHAAPPAGAAAVAPGPTDFSPNGGGPEATNGSGSADPMRENAADSTAGSAPDLPGSMTGSTTGSVLSPMPGPVDAVPTIGATRGSLSAPPSDPTPVADEEAPRSRREARESFLTHQQDEDPATRGFRGMLTRMGIRVGPSESERAERADERAVSQHWPGPRTISMVNGKGGAGKTPSTVLLAAVFAQFGGAGVVTWDNNQTRGTLGWRTEQGPHESTLLDLLPQTDRLLGPSAQAADLARYVHHQTRDRFDVLRSKPIAMANEQRIESRDVDAIHSVLSKYYRMILIDSGNDESDPMWQRMIDLTDQLVVATTTRDDHAEAGALLLEALATRDGRSAYLAQQAVVVVSQADQKEPASELEKVADGYRSLAREVVTIPFDPAMVDGHLRHGALRTDTRRAWLAAGAAVAGGL
ncbi:MinD-like ATPase involved in chromosome partitioning or flagellar assembly [Promicromonospora umidemergens]|uniref:MinD-like ATPase involved in chromosome partitioning or flagellar assembly n=1 Tax=Promicromonospora umidemergens TaxID=629679 RepID=A0ABP8XXT4_9MICO|nr:AAA family ATPase [Promicromonospora umidemergens]MCP2286066.1 MinD-like ATPase involved in chromosome partitioning or flagellar assembly [Promicromonospora umidemergens]